MLWRAYTQVAYPGGVIPDTKVAETTKDPEIKRAAEDLAMRRQSIRRASMPHGTNYNGAAAAV